MGSDRGIGPAPPRSPDYVARKIERSSEEPSDFCVRSSFNSRAVLEVTRRTVRLPELEPVADDDAAATEINDLFRRRLTGLRRLPRHDRSHALRAAREWRRLALKALREKRAAERHARHRLRQLQTTAPR
jgi:hypothetical protein